MKKQMLYRELVKYYNLIYSQKDYKKEAEQIKKLVSRHKKSKGKELLDVACGTGHHLKYLKKHYQCTGVDINKQTLKIAKKKVKGVVFKKADMTKLSMDKKFDIITCLFSSIGYVKTYANLKKAVENFAKHLKKGGVVIIEPWFTKQTYRKGTVHMKTYDEKNIKIARVSSSKIKGNISSFNMHYLIAEKNKGVKYFVDKHELGLFEVKKTLGLMERAGLKSRFLKKGFSKDRGLLLGIKK